MGPRGPLSDRVAYLDASAAAKALWREPESEALTRALVDVPHWTSSELLGVELRRVDHRRHGGRHGAAIRALLASVDLMPMTEVVLRRAGEPFDPPQRALDAIHLATLIELGLDAAVLLTYDADQAAAARAAGLEVRSPA